MRATDTARLALQNLRRTRLRTALSALGVAIGTSAVVTLISAGQGFQTIAVSRAAIYGSLTEILVANEADGGRPHPLLPATVQGFRSMPHVASVGTQLEMPPLRLTIGSHSVELPAHGSTPIGSALASGHEPTQPNGIVVPASVVASLGMTTTSIVGVPVSITAGSSVCCPDRNGLRLLGPDQTFPGYVAGVYNGGSSDTGSSNAIVSSEFAATIDGAFGGQTGEQYVAAQGYSMVIVQSDDARQTANVAAQIRHQAFRVSDRADLLTEVHLVFSIITAGLAAIGSIALLVAAIGIANTMIMTVFERTREIGIMKALGAEPGSIRSLFLMETGLVGILGGVVGVLLSIAVVFIGNAAFGAFVQSQDPGNAISNLFLVSPLLVVAGLVLATAISLAGGALPARRAVALQPLDALRYE